MDLLDLCQKQGKLLSDWVAAGQAAKDFIDELFEQVAALKVAADTEAEKFLELRDENIALEQEVQTLERKIKELRLSLHEPPSQTGRS